MPLHPFSALSFLSGSDDTPGLGAALNIVDPPLQAGALNIVDPPQQSAGLNIVDPPNLQVGLNIVDPPQSAGSQAPAVRLQGRRRSWPQAGTAAVPMRGQDPAWVYAEPSALLGQALRRARAKVVRLGESEITDGEFAEARRKGDKARGSDLWRWAPEFRVKTIVCELLSVFQVQQRTLIHLGPKCVHTPVYALPANFGAIDWSEQVDKVLRAATEREDRLPEILSQMNTYWPFYESLTGLQLARLPLLTELLAVAHEWQLHLIMLLKHQAAVRRPNQRSSLVLPVIPTPGHGALPSGHASGAAFMSELLYLLLYRDTGMRLRAEQLDRLARRIAFHRVVAGVHFPVDGQAGYLFGTQLARLFWALGGHAGQQPAPLPAERVICAPFELVETGDDAQRPPTVYGKYPLAATPTLVDLLQQVIAELARARV